MGACHQIIEPLANNGGWLWTKAVLQRSLKVNGDCMTMLGETCVGTLRAYYAREASMSQVRTGGCAETNNTVPAECEVIVMHRRMTLRE
jgi:hypothetical protein